MAQEVIPLHDFRRNKSQDGFIKTGESIRNAIVEKIEQKLNKQIESILAKLPALVPDVNTAVGFLAAFTVETNPDHLSPTAAQVFQLCRHLQSLTDEVAALEQDARNIHPKDCYRLSRRELRLYGL